MYGAGVIAHGAELFGLGVGRIRRIVDGVGRPDANEAIYREKSAKFLLDVEKGFRSPPAAVTSLFPSGEIWQL